MASKNNESFANTSYITDVLSSSEIQEKDDANAKLEKLSNRLQELKVEVCETLQKKYEEFNPNSNLLVAKNLSVRVQDLSTNMDEMAHDIEEEINGQLNVSAAECHDLALQLEEANQIAKVLNKLVNIHDLLTAIDKNMQSKLYVEATVSFEALQMLLNQPAINAEGEIRILKALHNKYLQHQQQLESVISESWSNDVKWHLPSLLQLESSEKRAELHIASKNDSNLSKHQLSSAAQALYNLNLLETKLKLFAKRFLQHFVHPIVEDTNASVTIDSSVTSDKNNVRHSVNLILKTTTRCNDDAVSPQNLFKKFTSLIDCMNTNLLDIEITVKDGKLSLMKQLGEIIATDCLELIVKKCLAPAIPSSGKDLDGFIQVIDATETFQKHLIEIGFLSDSDKTLTDFVGNVNVLFANKQCKQILEKARNLMTSEIHCMVELDTANDNLPQLAIGGAKKAKIAETITLPSESKLSNSIFKMPKCYISVSTQQLMQLAYETLEQATSSSQLTAIQLFYCVHKIFELFCTVVPTYHKEKLATLPQLAALHHNNCMFLAHHLLTLGHQYRARLPDSLNQGAAKFVETVPRLRQIGTECYMQMMIKQRDQLEESLKSANGFMNVTENLQTATRAVRQMLYQLQQLASVWKDVLPSNIFYKTIGTLLNSCLISIITSVISLEDISADDANHLYQLMSQITSKGKDLLSLDSDEQVVQPKTYVPKWSKFTELMVILNAGLQDIADRWEDGKGPLAHKFFPNEVKHLIRALFQNTSMRDAVLAKIKK